MRNCYRRFREKILSRVRFNVLSLDKTFEWMESGKSIVRFGDGELSIILGGRGPDFQNASKDLSSDLRRIFFDDHPRVLKCLPILLNSFSDELIGYNVQTVEWWRKWLLNHFWRVIYLYVESSRCEYGDAFVSRPYMRTIGCQDLDVNLSEYFARVRKLFLERDVVIVEGSKTRFGVGNDLLIYARSIRRILVPKVNAYQVKQELLEFLDSNADQNLLYILACGPLAKILTLRLSELGCTAWDLGHLDVEYEWYQRGFQSISSVPGKYVNEAAERFVGASSDFDLFPYRKQIVADFSEKELDDK